jgi:hypothetical protein
MAAIVALTATIFTGSSVTAGDPAATPSTRRARYLLLDSQIVVAVAAIASPGAEKQGDLSAFLGKPLFDMQQLFRNRRGRNIIAAGDGTVLAFHHGTVKPLSATRLGGMLAATFHLLGPPKVAGPLHNTAKSLAILAAVVMLKAVQVEFEPGVPVRCGA